MTSPETLTEYYRQLNDDALSQAYVEGEASYEPVAWSIVSAELHRRELPVPDSPAPHAPVEYAPLWNRVVGQFVDAVVATGPAFVISSLPLAYSALLILSVAWVAWAVFHLLLADGLKNGQSLGKRLAQTRVIHAATGKPCTYWQSLVRNLVLWFLGPIDWIFILGGRRQRLGDMVVGTIVVPAGQAAEVAALEGRVKPFVADTWEAAAPSRRA